MAVVFILLATVLPASAFTLRPHLIHSYTMEDGLPSSGVYGLAQGADGRLWFATRSEATAFDGYSWQCWSSGKDLPAYRLSSIHCDSSGAVWVVSRGHSIPLARWDGETWHRLSGPDEQRPESLGIISLAIFAAGTSDQVVAVGTLETGLWLLGRNQRWRQVGPEEGLPGCHVRSLVAVEAGFLVATEGGLARVSGSGSVDLSLNDLIPAGAQNLLALAVGSTGEAAADDENMIWLLSSDRLGLIEAGQYRRVCSGFRFEASRSFKASLLPLPSGAVYFGTHLELLSFEPRQGTVEPMGRAHGLLNEGATDLCLDREGNIWISGLRGVSKLVPTPFASFRASEGLLEDEVTAICEPQPGTLYLGHSQGLTVLEGTNFSTIPFTPSSDVPQSRRRTLDMSPDSKGNCWIADNGVGVVLLSRDRRLTRFGPNEGLPRHVTSVRVMPSGDVLAATDDGLFVRRGNHFQRLTWRNGDVPAVRRIFPSRNGTYFLATIQDGLWLADGDRLTNLPGLEGDDAQRVVAVMENPDGSAWVGTWGGLFLLRDGQLERPAPPLDQMTDPLFFIIRDHLGRVWFGTNDGVVRWDGEKLKRFGLPEGLAGRETNRAAGFVDSQSRIWIGTETGLSFFIEDEPFGPVPPPLVTVHHLSAGDEAVDLDGPAELGHKRNTLVFDFGAISFVDESVIRYQYYLEGFDETWLEAVSASTRRARYTNLPPGRFRFHLRAAGAPGKWSDPVTSNWITILKPFWLRWWFFLAVAAVLLQVGYWAVVAGSRKRYARRLTEEVAARTDELKESREHYRLLFHGAAVPKLIMDIEDGVVLDANQAANDLCGFSAGGLAGRRPEKGGPSWLGDMLDLCCNPEVGEEELQVTGQQFLEGSEHRDVEAWGARLVLKGRQCVLVTAMDISGRRRQEGELLRASKLDSLGILAGGIAHDFNNMLTAIMGNLSLAQADLPQGSELGQLVDSAVTASRNARRLTSQLLTFARGGAPVRRTADMGKLIRDAATLIMSGSSSTCEFIIDPDLWPAEVDEGQMNQLVSNLVLNACQAMPEGGRVVIRARNVQAGSGASAPPLNGPHLRITVVDEGEGIPAEVQGKLFDPYFSTKETGSGLGLATAYAIAQGHDGSISVQSSPGKGALFRVRIPAVPDAVVPVGEPKRAIPRGPGRVLVMDDEEQILMFYTRVLDRLGYDCATARDGDEAVRCFEEALKAGKPFHAVIMDLTIPGGMGGREAVRLLQRLDPEVKVVVASGYSSDPVLSDPTAYGFMAVLPKPFTLRAIADVLHGALKEQDPPINPA